MKKLEITSRRPIQLIHSNGITVDGTVEVTIENDQQMDEIERASEIGMLSYKVVGESNEMVVEETRVEPKEEEPTPEEPAPEEPPKEEEIVKESPVDEGATEEESTEEAAPEKEDAE